MNKARIATNARIAGVTLLLYIAAGVGSMAVRPVPLVHVVLTFVECFSALVLGVTLYRITCEQDADVAMLGLTCRAGEGVLGAVGLSVGGGNMLVAATFFAVGSTLFSWLLLRGRMIPVSLAWLGVVASVLLVAGLPLQLGGVLHGAVTQLMWVPMAAFEIPLALWLILKGVTVNLSEAV